MPFLIPSPSEVLRQLRSLFQEADGLLPRLKDAQGWIEKNGLRPFTLRAADSRECPEIICSYLEDAIAATADSGKAGEASLPRIYAIAERAWLSQDDFETRGIPHSREMMDLIATHFQIETPERFESFAPFGVTKLELRMPTARAVLKYHGLLNRLKSEIDKTHARMVRGAKYRRSQAPKSARHGVRRHRPSEPANDRAESLLVRKFKETVAKGEKRLGRRERLDLRNSLLKNYVCPQILRQFWQKEEGWRPDKLPLREKALKDTLRKRPSVKALISNVEKRKK